MRALTTKPSLSRSASPRDQGRVGFLAHTYEEAVGPELDRHQCCSAFQRDFISVPGDAIEAQTANLFEHPHHQLGPGHPIGEARIIPDPLLHQGLAPWPRPEDEGPQPGSPRLDTDGRGGHEPGMITS